VIDGAGQIGAVGTNAGRERGLPVRRVPLKAAESSNRAAQAARPEGGRPDRVTASGRVRAEINPEVPAAFSFF
jgi:hypothetical protein